ncbi:MAG: cupin domain-containing protein [Cyclobacteriaceae bacterium]|nr:cupin domain-containing protein [Cyclobacteriaceae bacterium]
MEKVNLAEKFKMIPDHWHPHVAGRLNGQSVKLVRVLGEFVWHHHDLEDELFLVISGVLHMELRDRTIVVQPGEFIIIPRGVEHRPVAPSETHILLFEPEETVNTGNQTDSELTRNILNDI